MYSLHRIHTIISKEHLLMKAKVADRGQVTIPKILRDRLGIRPGTILEFEEDQGKLVAVKAVATDAVDQLYGTLGSGRRTDDIMQELRGSL
jgi:antitoxin PrlF